MKTRDIIIVIIIVVIAVAMVALKVLPNDESYVKENDGVYQHIVMESGDLQLELRRILVDSNRMSMEYAVTRDGEFLDGYEVKLDLPDVYHEPFKLTKENDNDWQQYQLSVVNDLLDMEQTKLDATIEKEGKIIKFAPIDLDLSNYNIMYIGDVMINETMMMNECSVEISKIRYNQNTLDLYYQVYDTENSFVSYLNFFLYNDAGDRYRSDNTQWDNNSSVKVMTFSIDEAFNNSDTIKIEAHQANVTNIIETYVFSYDDITFEYEGFQYTLNMTDTEDHRVNFELICESGEIPGFPELVYKTGNGWDRMSTERLDDEYSLSSVYIPDFLLVDESDYKLSAQNIVDFYEEHRDESFDVEVIQTILPTLLENDVAVHINSDGSLKKRLTKYVWDLDTVLEIGISSPNDINIITESIEVDKK